MPSTIFTLGLLALSSFVSAAPRSTYSAGLPHRRDTAEAGLDELAKQAGKLYFGTAADIPDTNEINDSFYLEQFNNTKDFGQVVPTNAMKWMFTEPQQDVFDFTNGDLFVSLAQANGQLLRCHALVWHQQAPDWVNNGNWTKETLLAAIDNHVRKTLAHFGDACYAWDVVNEALLDDGTYRDSLYYNVTGTDYLVTAFKAAQETVAAEGLSVKLYYNDYNIESPGAKTTSAAGIVKLIQDAGVQIDGVGLQSHFVVGGTPSTESQVAAMTSYTDLGVEVAITELDIRTDVPATDAAKAQQVVDYQTTAAACVQVEGCVGVTLWDFVDTYSWIPGVFAGQGYAHPWYQVNGTQTPLVRKEAYGGIAQGLTPQAPTPY